MDGYSLSDRIGYLPGYKEMFPNIYNSPYICPLLMDFHGAMNASALFLGVLLINFQRDFITKEEIFKILDMADAFGYRLSENLKNEFIGKLTK